MAAPRDAMYPAYFETHFRIAGPSTEWPHEFVIISASATTGQSWTTAENEQAGLELERVLVKLGCWTQSVTGFSPKTGHAEPSWAAELPLEAACDLGQRFRQDALFHVRGDQLSVTRCDHRRELVPVGTFRDRLEGEPNAEQRPRAGAATRLVLQWWSRDGGSSLVKTTGPT